MGINVMVEAYPINTSCRVLAVYLLMSVFASDCAIGLHVYAETDKRVLSEKSSFIVPMCR
jgi:hypothetical protein